MERIDHATATAEKLFTEGNPASGVPATVVTADWLNNVQEEIIAVIDEAGIELDGEDQTQLLQAIAYLIFEGLDIFSTSHEWAMVQSYAQTELTISSGVVTWDMRYPNAVLLLTENVTSFTITNAVPGTTPELTVIQDATGGWSCAQPAGVKWPDATAPTFSAEPDAEDVITYSVRGTTVAPVIRGLPAQNFGVVV